MPYLRLEDTELFFTDTGPAASGETVVFSHGLLMSHRMFEPQMEALRSRYRCVAYDHRGQGLSAPSDRRCIDMGTATGDAVALIERLKLGPVHFVGLSMGGFVGLRLAARRRKLVRSLVLIATSAEPEPEANLPRYRAMSLLGRSLRPGVLAHRIAPILMGRTFLADPARRAVREQWLRHLRALPRSSWRAVNGVLERESVVPELGRIRCPTLILVGDEDVATPPELSERLQRGIRGSRLVVIPRAGHSATIEAPAAVTREISAFLQGLAPDA